MSKMTRAVINRLANYVYRLIDPRDGETFYVGVGKGSRVLDHVKGEVNSHKAIDLEVNESDCEDEGCFLLFGLFGLSYLLGSDQRGRPGWHYEEDDERS